jgi:hypothetical protein
MLSNIEDTEQTKIDWTTHPTRFLKEANQGNRKQSKPDTWSITMILGPYLISQCKSLKLEWLASRKPDRRIAKGYEIASRTNVKYIMHEQQEADEPLSTID